MKPHVHAALIKAWADGANIQCLCNDGKLWIDHATPMWFTTAQYRIKPREFPKTSLKCDTLFNVFSSDTEFRSGIMMVANAAIKQYILDTEAKDELSAGS